MLSRLRLLLLVALTLPCGALLSAQTTWTLRHQGAVPGDFLWSVTDGNAGAVAVGDGGKILHSMDGGRTWAQRASGTTGWLVAVTYGNGRYVAVGEGGLILTSPNGIGWARVERSGTTARLNNVVFGDGKFVAIGEGGAGVLSSDGGETWQPVSTAAGTAWLHGLAFGGGRWIATGQGGVVVSSGDAIDWSRLASRTTDDLEAVALAETFTYHYGAASSTYVYFLAIGQNGTTQVCNFSLNQPAGGAPPSVNAYTYLPAKPATTARFRNLTVGNKVLLAAGDDGSVYRSPSYAGPWERLALASDKNLVGAGFVSGTLLLVGEQRTILQSEPIYTSRLGNLSTRGLAGAGSAAMIAGTVVEGFTPKQFLIRGIGPALAKFGVGNTAADPVLSVYDAGGRLIAANTGWSSAPNWGAAGAAARDIGAFELTPAAKDCALLLTLAPGAYTFQLSNAAGTPGNALVEAYDLDALGTATRAINVSTRGQVGTGDSILIAGLVVKGLASRTLLIRGVGPGLAPFGVPGTLADPQVRVLDAGGNIVAANDNWSDTTLANGRAVTADEVQTAAAACGAFALPANSKDAALLVTLIAGNYTIQVSGVNNTTGAALVEAYDVPTY
jgi:hypothetical protein